MLFSKTLLMVLLSSYFCFSFLWFNTWFVICNSKPSTPSSSFPSHTFCMQPLSVSNTISFQFHFISRARGWLNLWSCDLLFAPPPRRLGRGWPTVGRAGWHLTLVKIRSTPAMFRKADLHIKLRGYMQCHYVTWNGFQNIQFCPVLVNIFLGANYSG